LRFLDGNVVQDTLEACSCARRPAAFFYPFRRTMAAARQGLDVMMLSPGAWLFTLSRVASVIVRARQEEAADRGDGSRVLRDGRGRHPCGTGRNTASPTPPGPVGTAPEGTANPGPTGFRSRSTCTPAPRRKTGQGRAAGQTSMPSLAGSRRPADRCPADACRCPPRQDLAGEKYAGRTTIANPTTPPPLPRRNRHPGGRHIEGQ
jgi:hypothetical protein